MSAYPNRIAIVGGPGSGKSTLARQLGARTGLPVFHMDHIHWKPNWEERNRSERLVLARKVLAREQWIFEGNYSKLSAERMARAEMLIWLDMRFGLRVRRVAWRTLKYFGRSRPDMQTGCREGMNPEMLRFIRYIWNTRETGRAKVADGLNNRPADLQLHHLTTPPQVRAFLQGFGKDG